MAKGNAKLDAWAWAGLVPFILIGLLILIFVLGVLNRVFWDFRTDQMCKVDGGDKVYQQVYLNRKEYIRSFGPLELSMSAPLASLSSSAGSTVLVENATTDIVTGFPKISRTVVTIYRASDKHVLAESISYNRIGGILPFVPTTSHRCGGDSNITALLKKTAVLKKKVNDI